MKFIESHVVYKGKRVILEEATYLDKKITNKSWNMYMLNPL